MYSNNMITHAFPELPGVVVIPVIARTAALERFAKFVDAWAGNIRRAVKARERFPNEQAALSASTFDLGQCSGLQAGW
jgi:hypothetical protein